MEKDFTRIAIVNRGEPAMRFIHAVQEYNRENGTALRAIALYTEPDRRAMFVREADEAVNLGAATYIDLRGGQRKNSYLDYERLERALLESRAEAVWVGWGFVAEHAEFVDLCNRLGLVFIGPSAQVMRQLGDKITSKLLAEQAGISVVPWSGGPVATLEEARFKAESLGYPLMIKATAGGGGRGIRKVQNAGELANDFNSAQSEALKAFGNATVFLEKQIKNARHVEVQIMGDHYGTVWAVGVRDCTIQRRNQKVLEEAPSPALTLKQDRDLRAAAVRLGQTLGYEKAGTVEFLVDSDSGNFWFMEVNARLQVEHPVTELTTGLDLVKLQIHVARGGKLDGRLPVANGHAIEVRLNAEDPANLFAPAPGKVALFRLPTGPGVRIDTGVAEGDEVPAEFDSMIAKIIAHGRDRHEALSRLKRALAETAVIIQGGMSNKGFLLALLDRPKVIASEVDVGWLDRLVQKGQHLSRRYAEIALLHAAIEAYLAEVEIEKAKFFTLAHRGRPQVLPCCGVTVELAYQGENYKMGVYRLGLQHYRIDVDGQRLHVFADSLGNSEWRLSVGGQSYRVLSMVQGHPHLVEVNGVPHRLSRDHLGVIRAPSPAVVISTLVKAGEIVKAGDRLALLEAMKMEMSIVAPFAGTVKEILVRNNIQVDTGAPLLMVEPCGQQTGVVGAERVSFAHLASAPVAKHDLASRCAQNMGEWNGRSLLYLNSYVGFLDYYAMSTSMYWLTQKLVDVPETDDWLTHNEIICLNKLRFPKRRADWRLGRWTAKRALAAYFQQQAKSDLRTTHVLNLDTPNAQVRLYWTTNQIEIRAATDGAPEAFVQNQPVLLGISLSHRDEIGFCAINPFRLAVGCDVEKVEPRSANFVADYFTTEEQKFVAQAPEQDRYWLATLIWSAKESALKALRQGLRLDTRSAVVDFDNTGNDEDWNPLIVRQTETSRTLHGWWRIDGKFVQTIVAEPLMEQPISLRI